MKQIPETFGARVFDDRVMKAMLPAMDALRQSCDRAETLTPKSFWPFPTYDDLLFW